MAVGAKNCFKWYGYASLAVHAHFNSITMDVAGHRTIEFPDGTIIKHTNPQDAFKNTIFGTLNH